MKKYFLISLTFALSLTGARAQQVLLGDANGDGTISVEDVATTTNILLGKSNAKQVNTQEFFIRENKLTGTYKINGEDKLFYKGYEVVDFGEGIYWFATNIGAYTIDQHGTLTNSLAEAQALLPEGCTLPTEDQFNEYTSIPEQYEGKSYYKLISNSDPTKFVRIPMGEQIIRFATDDMLRPRTVRPIFVGTIPTQGSGGSTTTTDTEIGQGDNNSDLE